jgi:tetratricopeptide (TPR) repeat protein
MDLDRGDYGAAAEKFARSLEIHRAIGDRAGEAEGLYALATIDLNRGDDSAAAEKLARSLEIRRALGDRNGEAAGLYSLASMDLDRGDYGAAAEKFARSLEIRRALGDRAGEAQGLYALATIDLDRRDYAAAAEKFARSLEITRAIGDREGEALTLYQLGMLAGLRGQGEICVRLVATCFLIHHWIGHRDAESDLRTLMALCQKLGYDQARFNAIPTEVGAAYLADRCQSLVEQVKELALGRRVRQRVSVFGWFRRLRRGWGRRR